MKQQQRKVSRAIPPLSPKPSATSLATRQGQMHDFTQVPTYKSQKPCLKDPPAAALAVGFFGLKKLIVKFEWSVETRSLNGDGHFLALVDFSKPKQVV